MTVLDYDRMLDVIGVEGQLMASSARDADHALDVPWCPGLTLGETVRHVGSVYRMVLAWLRSGERPVSWQRGPDEGQSTQDYLVAGLQALLAELERHDPAQPCPTWWPEQENYGFWRRRMMHETTVHRIDVQQAGGCDVARVNDDVALDGVDEVLTLWFGHRLTVLGVTGTREGLVAVRTGGDDWLMRARTGGTAAWRASEEDVTTANAVVTGDPMEMYLWLWGRRGHPTSTITVDGDQDAVAQAWALLRLATR